MKPPFLISQGNDYRPVEPMEAHDDVSVAVIVPVYNRTDLLANTLAGLMTQSYDRPFSVIVVDDGSDEDAALTASGFPNLDIQVIRQPRDGFGTPRARNRGVATTDADVVAFLDADCIPSPEWLARHMFWHRRARNLLVTGSRRHIDELLDPDEIRRGSVDFNVIASEPEEAKDPFEPDDWRRVVYRRSQKLLLGDGAFRAAIGGNSSLYRERFLALGGVSEEFRGWGGEDTEFAWRMWNGGSYVVPENRSMIYHQRHHDAPDALADRAAARERNLPAMADLVPHRFYRKAPSHLYSVPKVSWIISVETTQETARAWKTVTESNYRDSELILWGGGAEFHEEVSNMAERLTVAPDFASAVSIARGEVIAIVDGRARFDARLLGRAMRRYDDPLTDVVRVGYKSSGSRLLRFSDLEDVDVGSGRSGLPFFALVRRRELMKDGGALSNPEHAWAGVLERSTAQLLVTDLVEIPADAASAAGGRPPGLKEARSAGVAEIARGIKRAVRPEAQAVSGAVETVEESRPGIEYVGLAGHDNLGDDAMLEAIRKLMPWAEIGVGVRNPRAVMLGGGTLLNSGGYYLNKVRRVDGPNLERVVFGTGVKDFGYWGETENYGDWAPFIDSALSVGVRGPGSLTQLRMWGHGGPQEIIGDPALSLVRPEGIEVVDGRVVLCPVFTAAQCWGGDDRKVFSAFSRTVERLKSDGRDVVIMTAHPNDDRWAIEIMRRAGHGDLPYVPGYEDLDASLALISSSELVIGERLHAVVLAAAVGTPFVAVEYRPKLKDFALSVGRSDALVRTDKIMELDTVVDAVLSAGTGQAAETNAAVEKFRQAQALVAQQLQSKVQP